MRRLVLNAEVGSAYLHTQAGTENWGVFVPGSAAHYRDADASYGDSTRSDASRQGMVLGWPYALSGTDIRRPFDTVVRCPVPTELIKPRLPRLFTLVRMCYLLVEQSCKVLRPPRMLLRICYAKSGTDASGCRAKTDDFHARVVFRYDGDATWLPRHSGPPLRASYAMSGTELASGTIPLRASYAMSGTDIPYAAVSLRAYCAMPSTDIAYAAICAVRCGCRATRSIWIRSGWWMAWGISEKARIRSVCYVPTRISIAVREPSTDRAYAAIRNCWRCL
eukprot:2358474-Rhodomonas_salina.4